MKPIHLYQAWKLWPGLAKALIVVGYTVSGIIYWSGLTANPNYGCLTSICDVTRQGIELTKVLGIAMIILVSSVLVLFLFITGFVLSHQEDKGKTFEELEEKVKKKDEPENIPQ